LCLSEGLTQRDHEVARDRVLATSTEADIIECSSALEGPLAKGVSRVAVTSLPDVSFRVVMTPLLPGVGACEGGGREREGEEGESREAEHCDING